MMEQSSRFISLSGLAGVCAGIFSLIASAYVYNLLGGYTVDFDALSISAQKSLFKEIAQIALDTLVLSFVAAAYFTTRKSKAQGLRIWTRATNQMLLHMGVAVLAGGVVCLAFYVNHTLYYIAPASILFYGLGLLSASQSTYGDIKYLGMLDVLIGLIAFFDYENSLLYWMMAFGVLHIVYGLIMYKKYK